MITRGGNGRTWAKRAVYEIWDSSHPFHAVRPSYFLGTVPLRFSAVVLVVLLSSFLFVRPAPAQSSVNTVTWQAHPPSSHDFDVGALAEAVDHAASLAPLNSLLIARDSTLVAEVYFRGMQPTQGANLKSASKSILSALTGIALFNGDLESLDQPIGPFFPTLLADAPRKQQITIRHLLTQQAGLESTSFDNYGPWVTSSNWVADALRRPLEAAPGSEMIYSTGTTHLLAAVLTEATGQPLRSYAQEHLFDPLDTRIQNWQQDPQGIYFGGNNLSLTPRGLLRFGQLFLHRGEVGGRQIFPPHWVDLSWRTYVRSTYRGHQYGYLWFTHSIGGEHVAFAWGYGGQYVFVVPRLNLVVACTSSLEDYASAPSNHNRRILRLLGEHLIPAARGPTALDPWPELPRPFHGW